MANLTITAANVVPGANAKLDNRYKAGTTITAGQAVYIMSDGRLGLADCNATDPLESHAVGIAVSDAEADQPIWIQRAGLLSFGAILAAGTVYVLSSTAGAIAPAADGTTGWRTTVLGASVTTSILSVSLLVSGTART
jgi:hypothetical protein